MSLLNGTNVHHVLMEAAATELSAADSIFEDEIEASFEKMWGEIPELGERILYKEEAVPVIKIGEEADPPIVVEYDNLAKYMVSNNITDVVEAVNRLQEYYNIPRIAVAIASYDDANEVMIEAKAVARKAGNKSGLAKIKGSIETLQDLKDKGLQLFKQKGEKKGKK